MRFKVTNSHLSVQKCQNYNHIYFILFFIYFYVFIYLFIYYYFRKFFIRVSVNTNHTHLKMTETFRRNIRKRKMQVLE
jgi:hypothetical protein